MFKIIHTGTPLAQRHVPIFVTNDRYYGILTIRAVAASMGMHVAALEQGILRTRHVVLGRWKLTIVFIYCVKEKTGDGPAQKNKKMRHMISFFLAIVLVFAGNV